MRRMWTALLVAGLLGAGLPVASIKASSGWQASVPFTNQVASTPFQGGGYPVAPGSTAPQPGTCRLGTYNANRSESWLAVRPGSEDIVGVSKAFFEKYSTFYDFHLAGYTIPGGTPAGNSMITGYDCISTGSQEMPPSWTNDTDPNVDFDTQGRAYQITLPFNAYWTNLHPNGAIGAVYSDDLGRTWQVANGGHYIESLSNQTTKAADGFEDKQWVAVNHVPGSRYQDHVYAMWAVFDGNTSKVKLSVSRDRGATFSKPQTISMPQVSGPSTTYIYPSVDAAGDLYASLAAFPPGSASPVTLYVAKSIDDGATFSRWAQVATTVVLTSFCLLFIFNRAATTENFAASPTYPGHLYLTWESWDGAQMDV